jgi:hypothetical protein
MFFKKQDNSLVSGLKNILKYKNPLVARLGLCFFIVASWG